MKTFGKNSFSSSLKLVVDITLWLELLLIIAFVGSIVFQCLPSNDPNLKKLMYIHISQILFWSIAFFVTIQLRKIITSFKNEILFDTRIVNWLKNISYLFLLSFILNWILHFFIPSFESNNYRLITAFDAVDFKTLFLSAFIYVLSQVFKRGCELQEQSNLTI